MRLRRLAVVLLSTALVAPTARAHPGAGIVIDSKGRVFFVSMLQNAVMMIDRGGTISTVVRGGVLNLPHHLVMGRNDALYVASDSDGVVWKVEDGGKLTKYFDSKSLQRSAVRVGQWGDPFTIDSAGDIIALASPGDSTLVRITRDGRAVPYAPRWRFENLHFSAMAWGPDGTLYIGNGPAIAHVVGDSVVRLVPRHSRMTSAVGVAIDPVGNIWSADYITGLVSRASPAGDPNTPVTVRRYSEPTGVALAPNGDVYVLDNPQGGVRVSRIFKNGSDDETLFSHHVAGAWVVAILFTSIPTALILAMLLRKPTGYVDWFAWTLLIGLVVGGLYAMATRIFLFSDLRNLIVALFGIAAVRSFAKVRKLTRPLS